MNNWDEKWSQFLRDSESKHKYAAFVLLTAYLFINNSINAASSWTEFSRSDNNSVALLGAVRLGILECFEHGFARHPINYRYTYTRSEGKNGSDMAWVAFCFRQFIFGSPMYH